jgi:hypothetical protein
MLQHGIFIIGVAALPVFAVSCASAREDKAPDPTEYVIPPGARVETAEYVDTLATGEEADTLLIGGEPEFKTRVYGEELLRAPATGRDCLYFWLEIAYETGKVHYHLLTDIGENEIYVYVGGAYVEVDHAPRPEDRPPDVVTTYKAGEEPDDFPPPAHNYPEVTYRLWLLEPGVEYRCRVEKFGSAYESDEEGGEVIYEVYYHFTFR